LFGVNVLTPVLKAMLDLDEFGEWKTGRFRDIFLTEGGDKIVVYTRNGGGNRTCEKCPTEEEVLACKECNWIFDQETCPVRACITLKKHPYYVRDWDDEYDETYAYFEFNVPEAYKPLTRKLYKWQGEPKTVSQRFNEIAREIEKMGREELEKDPRFKPIVAVLKDIAGTVKGVKRCVICGKEYEPGSPGSRELTCSEECHKKLIDKVVKEVGEYKKVVDIETGKAYKVPTRHILEYGLKHEDLKNFPLWDENE
jgi:RecJ-like exonuclease